MLGQDKVNQRCLTLSCCLLCTAAVKQVDASRVSSASSWDATLKHLVSDVSKALTLTDNAGVNVDARLYKLLLYEQGGHFKPHQDTEKERGMIGTLVVQLPVEGGHTGGCLTVRHMGETFTHNFEQVSWQWQICNPAKVTRLYMI